MLRNIEDFKTYISHYKAAQEETANFLSYYDTKVTFLQAPCIKFFFTWQCLKEWQVLEVKDTEETQFSRFLITHLVIIIKPRRQQIIV